MHQPIPKTNYELWLDRISDARDQSDPDAAAVFRGFLGWLKRKGREALWLRHEMEPVFELFCAERGLPSPILAFLGDEERNTILEVSRFLANFRAAHKKTYYVKAALVELLRHTNLRHLALGDVRLPFHCVQLEFERSPGPIRYRSGTTGEPLQSVMISRTNLIAAMCGKPDLFGTTKEEIRRRVAEVNREYIDIMFAGYRRDRPMVECSAFASYCGTNDTDIGAMLAEKHADESAAERSVVDYSRLTLAIMAYITSRNADAESVAPRRERRDRNGRVTEAELLKTDSRYPYILLGHGVRAPSIVPEANGNGKAPRCLHLVQGHFRLQACGPRWSEREKIWIEPFWRGFGGYVHKDYIVVAA